MKAADWRAQPLPADSSSYQTPRPPPPKPMIGDVEIGAAYPCAPGALVRICELSKEWSTSMWLCPAGRAAMVAAGWTIRSHRAPPFDDLRCYVHQDGSCPRGA